MSTSDDPTAVGPAAESLPDEVNEQDWAEQHQASAPLEDGEATATVSAGAVTDSQSGEAAEADLIEQDQDAVTVDDDEHR